MTDGALTVHPGPGLAGRFAPPGDKSVTHRAYVLALLSAGTSRIEDPNPGADAEATLAAAALLGARVDRSGAAVEIHGTGGRAAEPDRVLDCGNSGTTLRLLAGALAPQPLLAVLTGDESLRRRPVGRIVAPLRRMGAWLWGRDADRLPPLVVRGAPLSGVRFPEATASAQVATCVLLAALGARGVTSVRTLRGVRDHTARMFAAFGVPLARKDHPNGESEWWIEGPRVPSACLLRVPGDPSAAAFFLAAAAAVPGASVTAEPMSLNPTRTALLDVLEAMGARVERRPQGGERAEPIGAVTVTGPEALRAVAIPAARVPSLIDEIPAWAVAAAAARGTSTLAGAGELRVKESDRIHALAANLSALGVAAEEREDGLAIRGGPVRGGVVDAADDHRIAMAFAVLASRASDPVRIERAGGIPTSYPDFTSAFTALGGRVVGEQAA